MIASKVSIIVANFNKANYVSETIQSVINQTYLNWELLIIDDGSSDDSVNIIESFSVKDNRIQLYTLSANHGANYCRNYGLSKSQGAYVIFLDADDLFFKNCLADISNKLSAMDDDTLIQYGYAYFKDTDKQPFHFVYPKTTSALIPDILFANIGPCHSICISKKLVDQVGYFDDTLKSMEDWDYWIRAAKCGAKVSIIPKVLAKYRYVKNSMSRNAFLMFESFKTVLQRAISIDSRIKSASPLNKNYSNDCTKTIHNNLIRMLGVSIMQKKVDESVTFFKQNFTNTIDSLQPKDIESMCSYLTFRYWYTKEDVKYVLDNIRPVFTEFFKKLGQKKSFIKKANYYIFKTHQSHLNVYQYGKIIGSCMNYLNRIIYQN